MLGSTTPQVSLFLSVFSLFFSLTLVNKILKENVYQFVHTFSLKNLTNHVFALPSPSSPLFIQPLHTHVNAEYMDDLHSLQYMTGGV